MRKLIPLLCLSAVSCTQNFIAYVKTPTNTPLLSIEQILEEVGLIDPSITTQKKSFTNNTSFPTGTLVEQSRTLVQEINTLTVPINSNFELSIDTENHLIALPHYSSPGIVYQAEQSIPQQGQFSFFIGEESGSLIIRVYDPDGFLQYESVWHIEISTE